MNINIYKKILFINYLILNYKQNIRIFYYYSKIISDLNKIKKDYVQQIFNSISNHELFYSKNNDFNDDYYNNCKHIILDKNNNLILNIN